MGKIWVMIAVASGSQTLDRTLASLSKCVLPESFASVIVIENGKEPRLKHEVARIEGRLPIVYDFTRETGKSVALNYGIKKIIEGSEDLIVFTDDDIQFQRDWLANYEKAYKKWGPGHYYGSSFEVDYEETPDPLLIPYFPRSAVGLGDDAFSEQGKTIFKGFNWAAVKRDLVKCNLFDPEYGPGSVSGATGQETDMQIRLRRNGAQMVLVPENPVRHFVPKTRCSIEWMKERSKRSGNEQYLKTNRKLTWVLRKGAAVAIGCIASPVMRGGRVYGLIFDWLKLCAFLNAWKADYGKKRQSSGCKKADMDTL